MQEHKREVHGRFVYNERQLLSIANHFKSDVRVISLHGNVEGTRGTLGNVRVEPSPCGFGMSVPTVAGDDEGHWDFGNMQSGWSPWHE